MPSVQITRTSPRSFRSLQKLLTNCPCNVQCLFPQGKLDTLSGKGEREEQGQGDAGPMDGAVERIRCIWSVTCETPYWRPLNQICSHKSRGQGTWVGACSNLAGTSRDWMQEKNQDLTHQFTVAQVSRTPLSPGFDLSQIIRISRKLQWASVQHLVVQDSQFHQGSGWWGLESCFYSCISYLWPHSGILSQDPKEVQWKRQKAWRSPAWIKQLGAMENDHKNNDDRLSHCFSFAENDS